MAIKKASNNIEMPVHPALNSLPMLDGQDFENFCEDIRQNGLIEAIVIHDGQIVDGRQRLLACREVGQEPRFIEWRTLYQGSMSLATWIWNENGLRRKAKLDQQAMAAKNKNKKSRAKKQFTPVPDVRQLPLFANEL